MAENTPVLKAAGQKDQTHEQSVGISALSMNCSEKGPDLDRASNLNKS